MYKPNSTQLKIHLLSVSSKHTSEAKKEGNALPPKTRLVPVNDLPTQSCVLLLKLGGGVEVNTIVNIRNLSRGIMLGFQRRSNFCPFERSSDTKKD